MKSNYFWRFYSSSLIFPTLSQVIPLHLPPGDTSQERTVQIDGSSEQIEAAKQLVYEVISEVCVIGYHFLFFPCCENIIGSKGR